MKIKINNLSKSKSKNNIKIVLVHMLPVINGVICFIRINKGSHPQ